MASQIARQLRYGLDREPSLLGELRQSMIYASVPLFIVAVAGWGWATGPADPVPGWVWFAAPVFALVTLGFVLNVVLKGYRLLRNRAPVVEIDTQPWRPGETGQIRIVDPDASSLESLDVFLVAEQVQAERVSLTTAAGGGWRFTEAVRHHAKLVTVSKDVLRGGGPFDRVLSAVAPAEAAANAWRWQILVVGRVARGVPREDLCPLRVETS